MAKEEPNKIEFGFKGYFKWSKDLFKPFAPLKKLISTLADLINKISQWLTWL
ncbi:MAG: hypothetical protein PHY02_03455 [Phycisphaerae bacterium]|nr:hypothetical protein [Phycisphaerae bacterium]